MEFKTFDPTHREIFVTFQKEGIHCYPEAATNPELADVAFLAYPHRHMFHFKVTVPVKHDNRDIEFIQLKRWCEKQYASDGPLQINSQSCEMLAEALAKKVVDEYKVHFAKVTVSEDGENGSTIVAYRVD